MLGLPSCSDKQWHRIAEWLGDHVTALAEWTCKEVHRQVVESGDQRAWVIYFDGYYLTRGHYSNNSSATLHYHETPVALLGLSTGQSEDRGTTGRVRRMGWRGTCSTRFWGR